MATTRSGRTNVRKGAGPSASLALPPLRPADNTDTASDQDQEQQDGDQDNEPQSSTMEDMRNLFDDQPVVSAPLISSPDADELPANAVPVTTLSSAGPLETTMDKAMPQRTDEGLMIVCSNCGRSWSYEMRYAGTIIPCHCGTDIDVPTPDTMMESFSAEAFDQAEREARDEDEADKRRNETTSTAPDAPGSTETNGSAVKDAQDDQDDSDA